MTCRHGPGDMNCSSHPHNVAAREREAVQDEEKKKARAEAKAELAALTPDSARYEIDEFHREGPHLVLRVLYPNCSKCSYEGKKVLVFLNVTEAEVVRWKIIDPHFRSPTAVRHKTEAPGPAARFPASDEGWKDAIEYAKRKVPGRL